MSLTWAFCRTALGLILSSAFIAGCLGPPFRTVGAKEYPDGMMEVRHYVVNRINHLEDTDP